MFNGMNIRDMMLRGGTPEFREAPVREYIRMDALEDGLTEGVFCNNIFLWFFFDFSSIVNIIFS